MKTNVQQPHRNRGITLIEITLVIALILGLTAVGTFGMAAYKKGSNAATCMTQQHRILKTAIGSIMHGIDNADEKRNRDQRVEISMEFYESIQPAIKITNEIRCPSYNTNPSRGEIIKGIFGTEDEDQILLAYEKTVDEIFVEWFGYETPEEGFESFREYIGKYDLGYFMSYDGNSGLDFIKQYGGIHRQIGKSAYIYIACPKNWSSYGVTRNSKNKIEYHTNW